MKSLGQERIGFFSKMRKAKNTWGTEEGKERLLSFKDVKSLEEFDECTEYTIVMKDLYSTFYTFISPLDLRPEIGVK